MNANSSGKEDAIACGVDVSDLIILIPTSATI
jgi:hypothetical protein